MPLGGVGHVLLRWLTGVCLLLSVEVQAIELLGVPKEEADLRIGCLYPMTGPAGQFGRDTITAIEMALERIAEQPGYPKLSVIVEDTKSKQYRSRAIARHLLEQEQVQILCGVLNSRIALEITELARETRTLFIGAGHASSRLTGDALHPWYFRINNNSRQTMEVGALYLQELQRKTHWKTLAYIGPDYDYGHQVWLDLTSALDVLGVEYDIVVEYYPRLLEADFSHYIDALVDKRPDIIVSGHWGDDFVAFVRQAKSTPLFLQSKLAGFDAAGDYYTLARLGSDLPAGLVLSARNHNNWPDTPANRRYVDEFFRRTGHYPTVVGQDAYAAIIAIAEAWKVAERKDPEGVRQAFPGLRFALPEDAPGTMSWIDPVTHQVQQVMAIGETVPDDRFPPATMMLGNWRVYAPERPTDDRAERNPLYLYKRKD